MRKDELINLFKENKGIRRFSQVLEAGFHRVQLKSLLEAEIIEKIGRGLYQLKETPPPSNPDLVSTALQTSKGVICLLSALFYHGATDEIPRKVDVAIPEGSRANKITYPPVQYFRFSKKAWEAGIETHSIDGHAVKIYNLEKTIADCFKFRSKVSTAIAREALKIAVMEKHVNPQEIMQFAKICRVDKIVKPYLEVLL